MMVILAKQYVAVSAHGELVVLRIGNFEKSMHYTLALQISAALLVAARAARVIASVPRRWHVAGLLHDAAAARSRWSRFREKLPELLKSHSVHVGHAGQIVKLSFGRTTADLPFAEAAKISQWLRIRGKEARNSAGDVKRHWSVIGNLAAAEAGERPYG